MNDEKKQLPAEPPKLELPFPGKPLAFPPDFFGAKPVDIPDGDQA